MTWNKIGIFITNGHTCIYNIIKALNLQATLCMCVSTLISETEIESQSWINYGLIDLNAIFMGRVREWASSKTQILIFNLHVEYLNLVNCIQIDNRSVTQKCISESQSVGKKQHQLSNKGMTINRSIQIILFPNWQKNTHTHLSSNICWYFIV